MAFEFNNNSNLLGNLVNPSHNHGCGCDDNGDVLGVNDRNDDLNICRLREECIIALKVYDSVRAQDCLSSDELGPARAAECCQICENDVEEGDIIVPPSNAAAVSIDKLRVKKVLIVEKEPSPFRNGYWDIDLKFIFEYRLTFREADGTKIGSVKANSIYNTKISLFGSTGTDLVVSTDLFCDNGNSTTIDADPFILVESKAVALSSEIKYCRRRGLNDTIVEGCEVDVTIGLFYIAKLFRIVNLTVESHGFCIPEETDDLSPINACEFFDNLAFPMDVFAPPQKPEFYAGVSSNIPRGQQRPSNCKKC